MLPGTAYLNNPQLGRFSTISYWLKNKQIIDLKADSIVKLFRVESLNDELREFALENNNMSFDATNYKKRGKPSSKTLPKIESKYIDFLHSYLDLEFDLVNHLRQIKGYLPICISNMNAESSNLLKSIISIELKIN